MSVISLREQPTESVVSHGGDGLIDFVRLTDRFPVQGALDYVDFARLPPGASVGPHDHPGGEEVYVLLSGSGVVSVDGQESRVRAWDVVINPPGSTHALRNDGQDALEFVVFKVPLR